MGFWIRVRSCLRFKHVRRQEFRWVRYLKSSLTELAGKIWLRLERYGYGHLRKIISAPGRTSVNKEQLIQELDDVLILAMVVCDQMLIMISGAVMSIEASLDSVSNCAKPAAHQTSDTYSQSLCFVSQSALLVRQTVRNKCEFPISKTTSFLCVVGYIVHFSPDVISIEVISPPVHRDLLLTTVMGADWPKRGFWSSWSLQLLWSW